MSRARVGARFAAAVTAALLFLVGCGGGADPSSATPALRAQAGALAAGSVSAQVAADMLMDVAEGRYSQFFPGHPTTQSLAPFAYRYYPATGIYLGVVVAGGTQYELNGVYVMGGSFGAVPTYVGPLSAFITPVDLSAGGTDNGCYDLSIYDSSGRQTAVTLAYAGVADTITFESQIGGAAVFQGQLARETAQTITTTSSAGETRWVARFSDYANHTGNGELTSYGSISFQEASGNSVSETMVYSPPFVERRYRLAIGESVAQTSSYSSTSYPSNSSRSITVNSITTYVGRETVTVPAGTYDTCKFETAMPGPGFSSTTEWVIVGQGISVKRVDNFLGSPAGADGLLTAPARSQTGVATSVMVNGQPL